MEQQPRKLTRDYNDRIISGVCAGVARYFDIPAWIIRLSAVILACLGIGFVLYPLAWFFMAPSLGGLSAFDDIRLHGFDAAWRNTTSQARNASVGVIICWIIIAIAIISLGLPHLIAALPAIALVVLGIYLLRPNSSAGTVHTSTPSATETTDQSVLTSSYGANPPAAPSRALPRHRNRFFGIVNGTAILALGVLVVLALVLDNFRIGVVLGVPAFILAVGTMISALRGRGRLLAAETVVVLLIAFPIAYAQNHYDEVSKLGLREQDERGIIRLKSPSDISGPYRISMGELYIDASTLHMSDTDITLDTRVGAGEIIIVVPKNVTIDTQARTQLGSAKIFGKKQDGFDSEYRDLHKTDSAHQITIRAQAGLGEITVTDNPDVLSGRTAHSWNKNAIATPHGTGATA